MKQFTLYLINVTLLAVLFALPLLPVTYGAPLAATVSLQALLWIYDYCKYQLD